MAVAIDFESLYSKDLGISSQGAWHYLNDPRCDVYLLAVFGEGIEFVGRPEDFDWRALEGKVLIAHNLAWDGLVLGILQERGIVPEGLKFGGSGCTANLSVYLGAPRNLAGSAKQLLGVDLSKDLRTWMKGKTWADAVAAGKEQELRDYCLRDARACHAIWEKYSARWPAHEQALARQTMLIGWRGFRVDAGRVEEGIARLERLKFEAARLLPWSDGDGAVLSPKALGEHCRKAGIKPPPSLSEDDPACEAWERQHGEQYPWVGAMRDYRKTNALLEKLKTMRARTRPTDGCMSYGLKYFGAATGRWSGDAGFNIQNLQRGESYGVDLRACIVPRPGNKLVTCDLAQIEPRCLAWLTGDQALLDQIAKGVPIYEAHARNTMGWRGGNLKKEDGRLYQLAKARCLGLGFGCGPEKFRAIARTMCGLEISEREAQETVAAFRASNRAVTGLWNRMQTDCRRSAGGNYEIELPSGRTLTYFNVSSRGGWTFQTERGGPVQRFYGGRLAENCLGGDTEVLTSRGWMPITDLLPHDLVWDGVEWVHHDGVVDQGERETIDFGGVRLTPDHKVLTRSGWVVAADASHEDAATVIEADEGFDDGCGVSRSTILYPEPEYQGLWKEPDEGDPPDPSMRVYDILNAGPRRRFTVRGKDGKPFIVSNCVQATARDVFAEGLLRIERAGFPILFHCHDEVVCEVPEGSAEEAAAEISRLMTTRPEWMPGIPLEAETQVSDRYCK